MSDRGNNRVRWEKILVSDMNDYNFKIISLELPFKVKCVRSSPVKLLHQSRHIKV